MSCTAKTRQRNTRHRFAFGLLAIWMAFSLSLLAQITPSDDSYTLTSSPGTNFGSKNTLEVESTGATTFIRFDLSSIPPTVNGSMVAKATLKIYISAVPSAGSFNVDLVTSPWTESTITANDSPTLGSAIASAVAVTTADKNQYVLVDVTAAAVEWLNGSANDGYRTRARRQGVAHFEQQGDDDDEPSGGTGHCFDRTGRTSGTDQRGDGGRRFSGWGDEGQCHAESVDDVREWAGSAMEWEYVGVRDNQWHGNNYWRHRRH